MDDVIQAVNLDRVMEAMQSFNALRPLVSIYVDAQNVRVNPAEAEQLSLFVNSQGCWISKKAYANWRKENSTFEQSLYNQDFDCIDVPLTTKNAVDKKLIADCERDTSNNPSIKIFILLTGDGDFSNLIRSLQAKGKTVIIFARLANVNQKLKKLANEFHFVDELPNLVEKKVLPQTISHEDATKCLIEAIETALKQGKRSTFEVINNLMCSNKRFPNYRGVSSIRKLDGTTFGKLSAFVAAVAAERKVEVRTCGQCKEMFLIEKS